MSLPHQLQTTLFPTTLSTDWLRSSTAFCRHDWWIHPTTRLLDKAFSLVRRGRSLLWWFRQHTEQEWSTLLAHVNNRGARYIRVATPRIAGTATQFLYTTCKVPRSFPVLCCEVLEHAALAIWYRSIEGPWFYSTNLMPLLPRGQVADDIPIDPDIRKWTEQVGCAPLFHPPAIPE